MTYHDKNKESSYITYLDASNLHGWAMSLKLPVGGFKWVKKVSRIVDVEYPKNLHDLHSDLPFLPERMKINKCSKLVCNLYDKNNYVVHIRSLKQALNHGLILKKFIKTSIKSRTNIKEIS